MGRIAAEAGRVSNKGADPLQGLRILAENLVTPAMPAAAVTVVGFVQNPAASAMRHHDELPVFQAGLVISCTSPAFHVFRVLHRVFG